MKSPSGMHPLVSHRHDAPCLAQGPTPSPYMLPAHRRQQAHGDASPLGRARNVFSALSIVARSEGLAGLFKGLSLNLVKNPIATAVSFTVNDMVKDFLMRHQHPKGLQ